MQVFVREGFVPPVLNTVLASEICPYPFINTGAHGSDLFIDILHKSHNAESIAHSDI